MPTNRERTEWAKQALGAYKPRAKDEKDIEANIIDLITDLLHLHSGHPRLFGADQILAMTKAHYHRELAGK